MSAGRWFRLLPRPWAWPGQLRRMGVLGINARNLRMLAELNPRRLYPRVDDKLLTKRICEEQGIPVPETYAVFERYGDLAGFEEVIARSRPEGAPASFVIKPARGAAGRGVLIVAGRGERGFLTAGGGEIAPAEVRYHLSEILSGLHSLGGRADRAIVERRVLPHPVFDRLAVGGAPDVRVLVHRGEPVMAMLRLPTRASGGRANLHQGAVGAGVDMASGRTMGGVCGGRVVEVHPDTGAELEGLWLPGWPEILTIAARLGRALELGYCGVDVVLDAERGALVLEANARPGLAVQVANRAGLLDVLAARGTGARRAAFPADAVPEEEGARSWLRRFMFDGM